MTRVLDLIERHWRKAQRRWKKGSQLRDSGAANYDAFMHGEAVGQSKAYQYCAQWIKEYLRSEDETVTDCNEYSAVEEELDAFIKSGKAIKEENCGNYTTTYIDPLKLARHFAKWGAEYRDRSLKWIRDLIKVGIKEPEEALGILKRIDELINDRSLWEEYITQSTNTK